MGFTVPAGHEMKEAVWSLISTIFCAEKGIEADEETLASTSWSLFDPFHWFSLRKGKLAYCVPKLKAYF